MSWPLLFFAAGQVALLISLAAALMSIAFVRRLTSRVRILVARTSLPLTSIDTQKYMTRLSVSCFPLVYTKEEAQGDVRGLVDHIFGHHSRGASTYEVYESETAAFTPYEDASVAERVRFWRSAQFESLCWQATFDQWPYNLLLRSALNTPATDRLRRSLIDLWKAEDALHAQLLHQKPSVNGASTTKAPAPVDWTGTPLRSVTSEADARVNRVDESSEPLMDLNGSELGDLTELGLGSASRIRLPVIPLSGFEKQLDDAQSAALRAFDELPVSATQVWIPAEDWLHYWYLAPDRYYLSVQLIVLFALVGLFLASATGPDVFTRSSDGFLRAVYFPLFNSAIVASCLTSLAYLWDAETSRLQRQFLHVRGVKGLLEGLAGSGGREDSHPASSRITLAHINRCSQLETRRARFLASLATVPWLYYPLLLFILPALVLDIIPGYFTFFPYVAVPTMALVLVQYLARFSRVASPHCSGGKVTHRLRTAALVFVHMTVRTITYVSVVILLQLSFNFNFLYRHSGQNLSYFHVAEHEMQTQSFACNVAIMTSPTSLSFAQYYIGTILV